MNHITKSVITALFLIFLWACNESSTTTTFTIQVVGNTPTAKLMANGSEPVSFTDGTTTFVVTEAKLQIRDIKLDTSLESTGSEETIDGPWVMDLLSGDASPQNIDFTVPPANYKRIDIRVDETNIEDGTLPEGHAMLGNSLYVKGTHNYNGGTGNFSFIFKFSEDIRFEPSAGIEITADQGVDMAITLRINDWLEDRNLADGTLVDLSACLTSGEIVMNGNDFVLDESNQGKCNNLVDTIKENMKDKYDVSSS